MMAHVHVRLLEESNEDDDDRYVQDLETTWNLNLTAEEKEGEEE